MVNSLILTPQVRTAIFRKLLDGLPSLEQRNFIQNILQLISKEPLSTELTSEDNSDWWKADADVVSAAAGLINLVLGDHDARKAQVITWLTSASGAGVGDGIAIRRASVTALSANKADLESIFDRSLQQFGDQLYIGHTPAMQQEGMNLFSSCIPLVELMLI
jgi:telomere length regulation protein